MEYFGFAVAQEVDRDDAIAPLGQVARQRRMHLLGEQQAVDEHAGPGALAVLRVGKTVTLVCK
jgi:hypothetical protein